MDLDLVVPILSRWLHIFAAIIAVGGSIFIRFILTPIAKSTLDAETHLKLRETVTRRWMKWVHTCILLFLISGFYNYLVVTRHVHEDQPLYHALFGMKFLLALVVFGLAIFLTLSRPIGVKLRDNGKVWMSLLILCAAAIVMISGVMKNIPQSTSVEAAMEETAAE
jgi:uncharacterized membrane protein